MTVQDVIRQSVDNYIERDIIIEGLQCINPSITKMNAHWRVQWCKNNKHWSTEMLPSPAT